MLLLIGGIAVLIVTGVRTMGLRSDRQKAPWMR